jgi:hypothetical protein
LNDAFKNADIQIGLSLEHSIEWVEQMIKYEKIQEALNILNKSLNTYKSDAQLWSFYLKIKVSENTVKRKDNELVMLFNKAIESVKSKESLNIWQLIVDWCLLNNYSQIEKIFQVSGLNLYLNYFLNRLT